LHGTFQDITKRKVIDEENKHLENITHSQNQLLKNFAHIVSHNLRSHASNFLMLLSILENEVPNATKNEFFPMMLRAANNMNDTVENLGQMVEVYAGLEAQIESLTLYDYVARNIETVSATIIEAKAEVKNLVSPDLKVYGIPAYLGSISLNILTNALKYRHPKRTPEIVIRAKEQNAKVTLTVEDNGLGIDLEKFGKKLFTMFGVFHGNKDANGMGLFITKNQVEAMGGTISVESEVGKGSKFSITLKKSLT